MAWKAENEEPFRALEALIKESAPLQPFLLLPGRASPFPHLHRYQPALPLSLVPLHTDLFLPAPTLFPALSLPCQRCISPAPPQKKRAQDLGWEPGRWSHRHSHPLPGGAGAPRSEHPSPCPYPRRLPGSFGDEIGPPAPRGPPAAPPGRPGAGAAAPREPPARPLGLLRLSPQCRRASLLPEERPGGWKSEHNET